MGIESSLAAVSVAALESAFAEALEKTTGEPHKVQIGSLVAGEWVASVGTFVPTTISLVATRVVRKSASGEDPGF